MTPTIPDQPPVIPTVVPAGQMVELWRTALVAWVRSDDPDLTNRQVALLLVVGLEPGPHTVRGLASRLAVAKPVITRAASRLAELNFVRRLGDPKDGRNVFIVATDAGMAFLDSFAQALEQAQGIKPAG